ncbi:hypothetical protein CEXT_171671 [Caerostris extrusa]|uniref:Uncharacterized protein n=1 Tax=Caerostris extrusa TaxID=172846 RepID=A0AAV4QZZ7_CAEEX|nr:hypothetical protein CEXT_171671 [Caerostris extrusa]
MQAIILKDGRLDGQLASVLAIGTPKKIDSRLPPKVVSGQEHSICSLFTEIINMDDEEFFRDVYQLHPVNSYSSSMSGTRPYNETAVTAAVNLLFGCVCC